MLNRPDKPFSFLQYSRSQQLGLLVVSILIIVVGGLQIWSPFSPGQAEIDRTWTAFASDFQAATQPAAPESFFFDPNTVSKEELVRLGLKPGVANSWLKYRGNRKNAFRQASDIRKLYRLDSTDADRLLPLVRIATSLDQMDQMASEVAKSDFSPANTKSSPANFFFDPNTVARNELIELGLSEKQADAFLKYRAKASPFTAADDLNRIRVLTDKNLRHLKPLVKIASPETGLIAADATQITAPQTYGGGDVATPVPYESEKLLPDPIDINNASQETWESLPGIGPYRSGRIIRFRTLLGGFYSIDQVGTTYGLPDSTFQQIQPYLRLGAGPTSLLKINQLSAEDLASHPYINKKIASILVKYRQNHGPFESASDLEKIRILKTDQRKQLLPYLDFSQ